MTTTSPVELKPSISTRSWLSVCSRSLELSEPRRPPTASSSSMKMIAGACLRASLNSRRIRAAPRPANISTNDAADCEKNCAPDSWATALASSVLPVPGGPCSSTPAGTRAPMSRKRLGSRRKSTTSRSSSLASSTPAMSSQPIEDFTSGLICTGFVRGMSFSVRHKKKAMTNMKMIMKTPDHSVPKFLTWSRKLSLIVHLLSAGAACNCSPPFVQRGATML